MFSQTDTQQTSVVDDYLLTWLEAFYIDRRARGDVLIRQGKGRKPRYVFIGKQSRRALSRYLKHRTDDNPALWVTLPRYGAGRLTYYG